MAPSFCILAEPRSGGNLLQTTLGSHPEIEMLRNEPFGEPHQALYGPPDQENPCAWICSKFQGSKPARGFRLLHCQPGEGEARSRFLNALAKENWLFIHLFRRNKFEQIVSHHAAERTGRWVLEPYMIEEPFPLAPEEAGYYIRYTKNLDFQTREFLASLRSPRRYLSLTYEELTRDFDESIQVTCDFLGIPSHPNPVQFIQKQMRCAPDRLLTNAEMIRGLIDEDFPQGWEQLANQRSALV